MKLSRNYLTQDEVSYIVFEICKKANPFEMEIIKIALMYQILNEDISFEGSDMTCNEIYDLALSEGFDYHKIINYDVIDRIVDKETGIEKIVSEFLNDINNKVTKSFKKMPKELKNIKYEDIINKLKEVIDNGNSTTEIQNDDESPELPIQ